MTVNAEQEVISTSNYSKISWKRDQLR